MGGGFERLGESHVVRVHHVSRGDGEEVIVLALVLEGRYWYRDGEFVVEDGDADLVVTVGHAKRREVVAVIMHRNAGYDVVAVTIHIVITVTVHVHDVHVLAA